MAHALLAAEARRIERPARDQDSLKKKFDKLAAVKNPTGDPSCPPEVKRAKRIARDIGNRRGAINITGISGDEKSDSEAAVAASESAPGSSGGGGGPRQRPVVGVRRKRGKSEMAESAR